MCMYTNQMRKIISCIDTSSVQLIWRGEELNCLAMNLLRAVPPVVDRNLCSCLDCVVTMAFHVATMLTPCLIQ